MKPSVVLVAGGASLIFFGIACKGEVILGDVAQSDAGGNLPGIDASDASDGAPTPPAPPVTDSLPSCTSNCTPHTLAVVATATRLACTPQTIYVSNVGGQLFAVPIQTPTPTELTPKAAGVVGGLASYDGKLFYTLPAEGEVRVRDVTNGQDSRVASGQASPQGIVAGTDVFFVTESGISKIAPDAIDQSPSSTVVFADLGFPPRGAGKGLALAGVRFVVAHAALEGMSGSLGTYTSTGEQISYYTFMGQPIGVATSNAHTYWSEGEKILSGPRIILANGLAPEYVVSDQIALSDICYQDGRIYFIALNEQDLREIRYVEVE